jgi:hypothetical protein
MRYGIEIEIENLPDPFLVDDGECKEDGSLRNNGKEYVSIVLPDVDSAKAWHAEVVRKCVIAGADFNHRCGTHIHMDFRDTTKQTRRNFLEKYLLIERKLMALMPDRSHSNFCLPLLDYDGDMFILRSYLAGSTGILRDRGSKYAALNFKPMLTQGSIEFRMLPSLPTVDLFEQVIDMLEFIRNNTKASVIKKYGISKRDVLEVKAFMVLLSAEPVTNTVDMSSMTYFSTHFSTHLTPEPITPQSRVGITLEDVRRYLEGL